MKKNYLLVMLFTLCTTLAFAQEKRVHEVPASVKGNQMSSKLELSPLKAQVQTLEDVNMVSTPLQPLKGFDFKAAGQKAPAAALETEYPLPDGAMFLGYTSDYGGYNATYVYAPAAVKVPFEPWANDPNATFSWFLPTQSGEQSLAESTDEDGVLHYDNAILPAGYIYNLPKVTATLGEETASYQLGSNTSAQYLYAGNVKSIEVEEGEFVLPFLTLGNNNANRPASGNLYSGWSTTEYFGPGYAKDGVECTGILTLLPQQLSPLYTESIDVLAYANADPAVPAGGELTLTVRYLNADGTFGDVIATATTDEFVATYNTQGIFHFEFEEIDDLGLITKTPLVIGTDAPVGFFVEGFDLSWNVRFLIGSAAGWTGSAYTLHGNNISTFAYTGSSIPATHLYFQFNGFYNCLSVDEETNNAIIPVEGGWAAYEYVDADGATQQANDIIVYSSFPISDDDEDLWLVEEETSEWLDIEVEDKYWAGNAILQFFLGADALPADITGRTGKLTLASHGAKTTITVTQGDVGGVGISPVKAVAAKAARQGDDFKLTYPASATSVAVYNVTGQKVGDYPLNASGSYTLPAAGWANGVYILKFNGSNTTVKVIK